MDEFRGTVAEFDGVVGELEVSGVFLPLPLLLPP